MQLELGEYEFQFLKNVVANITVNASQADGAVICQLVANINSAFAQAEKNRQQPEMSQPQIAEAEMPIEEASKKKKNN